MPNQALDRRPRVEAQRFVRASTASGSVLLFSVTERSGYITGIWRSNMRQHISRVKSFPRRVTSARPEDVPTCLSPQSRDMEQYPALTHSGQCLKRHMANPMFSLTNANNAISIAAFCEPPPPPASQLSFSEVGTPRARPPEEKRSGGLILDQGDGDNRRVYASFPFVAGFAGLCLQRGRCDCDSTV